MNQTNSEHKSQTQENLAKDNIIKGDFTFAPVQIGTHIETQIIEISADKVTQQALIKTSPYKGLKRFNFGDRDYFFGRDALIAKLFKAVNNSGFSLVLGASGSGKSSMVRAGLIPELKKSVESQKFYDFIFTPNHDPFESLYRCLLSEEKDYRFTESEAKFILEARPDSLYQVIGDLKKNEERWFFFIDQFEELFTRCTDLQKRKDFIEGIIQVAKKGESSVKIVLGMRSDFLEEFSFYPTLGALANQNNIHLVTEMYPDELRQAIEQPAAKHGVVFEKGLVEQIIEEVEGQKGYLPLLQYTLDLFWESECRIIGTDGHPIIESRLLTKKSYAALEGVRGALQKRINEIYNDIRERNKDGEAASKQIFLKLVSFVDSNSGSKAVSRRAYRNEFAGELLENTLTRFVNENLLVSSYDEKELLICNTKNTEHATIEIAHEILLSSWDKLKSWIEEEKEAILLKSWLADETRRWLKVRDKDDSKADDELLKGARLDQIVEFREKNGFEKLGRLTKEENEFIDVSVEWRNKARVEKERRRKIIVIGLSVFLVIVAIAWWQRDIAKEKTKEAVKQKEIAILKQSLFLADLSRQENEAGRAANGILLALEALPKDMKNPDRPYIFQAEAALYNAVANYHKQTYFIGHQDEINDAVFSRDGRFIASASSDKTARIWDAKTGKTLVVLKGHTGILNSVDFSPDSKNVVTASSDGSVRLWEVATGKQINSLMIGKELQHIRFSNDGKLALISGKSLATALEVSTNKTVFSLQNINMPENNRFSKEYNIPAFDPNGKYVAASDEKSVNIWKIDTGEKIISLKKESIEIIKFTPNGKYMVIATTEGEISLWNLATSKEIGKPNSAYSFFKEMDFSSDSKHMLTISTNGNTAMTTTTFSFDIDENKGIINKEQINEENNRIDLSGGSLARFTGNSDNYSVTLVNEIGTKISGYALNEIDVGESINDISYSQKENLLLLNLKNILLTLDSDFILSVPKNNININNFSSTNLDKYKNLINNLQNKLSGNENICAISSDGKKAIISIWHDNPNLIDVENRNILATLTNVGWTYSAMFSLDDKYLITSADGEINLTDKVGMENINLWRAFPSTQDLIDFAKQVVSSRELTQEQRKQFFLNYDEKYISELEQWRNQLNKVEDFSNQQDIPKAFQVYSESAAIGKTLIKNYPNDGVIQQTAKRSEKIKKELDDLKKELESTPKESAP